MLEGLNAAASGMAAQQQKLDAISSDLANANTTGYKSQRVGFRDLLYGQAQRSSLSGVNTGNGAAAVDVGRDFSTGAYESTGRALDTAIHGDGFFSVRLPDGRQALTRAGDLQIDGLRRLTTGTGAILQPPITIPKGVDESDVEISRDGTVRAGGQRLGSLRLLTVAAPDKLTSVGDTAFITSAASGAATAAPRTSTIESGVLESSNVDMASAMVAMIDAQRSYELQSKAIQAADQMMQTANEVKK
jgi:flagellar basal-body rod protein FlgG